MTKHHVLVCGGRGYENRYELYMCLDGLVPQPTLIISGGARGADELAADWADYRKVQKQILRADWKKYGRRAGPIRNQAMLELKPHLVVAFPGGRGTADMVRRSKIAGVSIIEVDSLGYRSWTYSLPS